MNPSLRAGNGLGVDVFALAAAAPIRTRDGGQTKQKCKGKRCSRDTAWEVKAEGGWEGLSSLPHRRPVSTCFVSICFVEMELSLARRENSRYANKELKGRRPNNLGLSWVEGMGRNLLKSDTFGGRYPAYTEGVVEIW